MSKTTSLYALIASPEGTPLDSFLRQTPLSWTKENMVSRYSATMPRDEDPAWHPSRICCDYLMDEYATLRSLFVGGKLSTLLASRQAVGHIRRPLGSGMGWDFCANGDVDHAIVQLKTSLLSAARVLDGIPPDRRNGQNAMVIGVAGIVLGAFRYRAERHNWRDIEVVERVSQAEAATKVKVTGGELACRWSSRQSYDFLSYWVMDRDWCWRASKCSAAFGPIDDITPPVGS